MKPSDLYPRLRLLPYQSAFAANTSRFKIGLWARQTGKDHTAAAEAVIDCLFNPGTTWIILAASERQALESLAKAKDWAAILNFQIDEFIEAPPNIPSPPPPARSTSTEIRWSNGSRLIALPANPQTVRGYSANLILTEFAFHENADAIWRAIYPSISNPLRGGLKKLRIISTPNGLNNKFADLWLNTPTLNVPVSSPACCPAFRRFFVPYSVFRGKSALLRLLPLRSLRVPQCTSKAKITIHDAIANKLPLNADELRAGLNDEDAWSQEYLCEFMDSSSVMFPYDLIAPCESEQATETNSHALSTYLPALLCCQPMLYRWHRLRPQTSPHRLLDSRTPACERWNPFDFISGFVRYPRSPLPKNTPLPSNSKFSVRAFSAAVKSASTTPVPASASATIWYKSLVGPTAPAEPKWPHRQGRALPIHPRSQSRTFSSPPRRI